MPGPEPTTAVLTMGFSAVEDVAEQSPAALNIILGGSNRAAPLHDGFQEIVPLPTGVEMVLFHARSIPSAAGAENRKAVVFSPHTVWHRVSVTVA